MQIRIIIALLVAVTALSACNIKIDLGKKPATTEAATIQTPTEPEKELNVSKKFGRVKLRRAYSTLNEDEKSLYRAAYAHIEDFTDEEDEDSEPKSYLLEEVKLVDYSLTDKQIAKVRSAILRDNPDLFYLSSRYYYTEGNDYISFTFKSNVKEDEYRLRKKKLNAVIKKIIGSMGSNLSEFERELYIHDYIIKNCKYDDNADDSVSEDPYTAYGCLVKHKAVCEGYTAAFQLLLSYAGIESYSIDGSGNNDSDANHTWNVVKIGGSWYHTDITWDDGKPYNRYDYFNLTQEQILKSHAFAPDYDDYDEDNISDENGYYMPFNLFIPECYAVRDNYFRKTAAVMKDIRDNDVAEKLADAAQKGEKYFNILIDPDYLDFGLVYDQLFADNLYTFSDYIKKANDLLGYDALSYRTLILKKPDLDVINIELEYN